MLRLVAILLFALLGHTAAEGIVRRPGPRGTASWETSVSSPSQPAPRVQRGTGAAEAVAPQGVVPHSGPTPYGGGKALLEPGRDRPPTRAAIRSFSLASVSSGARLVAFPYDANAPPRLA